MGLLFTKSLMVKLAEQKEGGQLTGSFIATYKLDSAFEFAHHLLAFGEDPSIMERLPPPHPPLRPRESFCKPDMFEYVDAFAKRISKQYLLAPHYQLGRYIQENVDSDPLNLARFIYCWITKINITVLPVDIKKPPDWRTLMYQLWRIKAGKGTWAQMVSYVCRLVNMPCVIIHGKIKHGEYELGKWSHFDQSYGEWNALLIGSDWWLVDCHWGAYALHGDRPVDSWHCLETGEETNDEPTVSTKHTTPQVETEGFEITEVHIHKELFFLADPTHMVSSHLPVFPEWQLMHRKMTELRFDSMVYLGNRFFDMHMGVVTHPQAFIFTKEEVEFVFSFPPEKFDSYHFGYKLHRLDSFGTGKCKGAMVKTTKRHPDFLEVEVRCTYPALLRLEVLGRDMATTHLHPTLQRVFTYLIKTDVVSIAKKRRFVLDYMGSIKTMQEYTNFFEADKYMLMQVQQAVLDHEDKKYSVFLHHSRTVWKNPGEKDELPSEANSMDEVIKGETKEAKEGRQQRKLKLFLERRALLEATTSLETGGLYGAMGMEDVFGVKAELLASHNYVVANTTKMMVSAALADMPAGGLGSVLAAAVAEAEADEKKHRKSQDGHVVIDPKDPAVLMQEKMMLTIEEDFERALQEANTNDVEKLLAKLEMLDMVKRTSKFTAMGRRKVEIFDLMDAIEEAMSERNSTALMLYLSVAHEKGYMKNMGQDFVNDTMRFRDRLGRIDELARMINGMSAREWNKIRSKSKPPEVIYNVLLGCFQLFGYTPDKVNTWPQMLEQLSKTEDESFKHKIKTLDPGSCSEPLADSAAKTIDDMDDDLLKITSIGAYRIFQWLVFMIEEVGKAKEEKSKRVKRRKGKY